MRPSRIAMFVAPCLLLAACGSGGSAPASVTYVPSLGASTAQSASPSPAGGIGSTFAVMSSVHGPATSPTGPCAAADACFGADVVNTESGATPAFTSVIPIKGLVGDYQQNFATGTTAASAIRQVMQFLPSDAHATALTPITGAMTSCAFFNVSSPTLAALFPDSVSGQFGSTAGAALGVELSTTNGQGFTLFQSTNVQRAHLTLGGDDSSMAC